MNTKRTNDEIDSFDDLPDDYEGDPEPWRRWKAQNPTPPHVAIKEMWAARRRPKAPTIPTPKTELSLKEWARQSAQEMADGLNKLSRDGD